MKKSLMTLLSLSIVSLTIAQTGWDQGDLSITYGSPIPNQTWELSGSILNSEIPSEGVGGFSTSINDTSLTVVLAYELFVEGVDTLADAFLVVLQEPGELQAGTYSVDPTPGQLKLFAWFQEVDPELVMGLLDSSFAFEDLSTLNPYLSLSGEMEVLTADPQNFEMNISGMLVNTSFQIIMISAGSIHAQNSLPIPVYGMGSLDLMEDGVSSTIAGSLNPLVDTDGVGLVFVETGDTLSYTFLAYADQGDNRFDVYGLELMGTAGDLSEPLSVLIPLSADPGIFPRATPVILEDLSLDSLSLILQTGDISSLTEIQDVFLPVGVADAYVSNDPGQWMRLDFNNLLMASLSGETKVLSQGWYVGNQMPTSIDLPIQHPTSDLILGAAYPNPFNSRTIIPLELTNSQNLELTIFNILGQEKMSIQLGYFSSGSHQIPIDLSSNSLSGGFYHFQVTGDKSEAKMGSFLYLK